MRRANLSLLLVLVPLAFGPGCDCSNDKTGDGVDGGGVGGGVGGGAGGGTPVPDGGFADGGVVVVPGVDGGASTICQLTACPDGNLFACGDCVDNDGDGKMDTGGDPDCLGPCDNNEAGYDLMLTGQPGNTCRVDCYYDSNSGRDCDWAWQCDPLEPRADDDAMCDYVGDDKWGGTFGGDEAAACSGSCTATVADLSCWELQQTQNTNGLCDSCADLTPPGCDCFGCCEIPARSGNTVFIGTRTGEGAPTCDFEAAMREYDLSNPDATPEERLADLAQAERECRLCTQQAICNKPCGGCDLCLGETELPPECTPGGTTDGGMPPPGEVCGGGPTCAPISNDACAEGLTCFFGCCLEISPL
jgi:hypothetical protein